MEVFHEAPAIESFTPLSEHQSQTPESFYSGPPVLYHHSPGTRVVAVRPGLNRSPALAKLLDDGPASTNGSLANGHSTEDSHEDIVITGVDIWVTSE